MPWTYILECRDGSFYTGSTNGELASRVWQHNHDDEFAATFTRKRRPVSLVYAERFDTVDAAFRREKQIQGWSRAKKQALIELRGRDLPRLSRNRAADASTGSATQPRHGSATQPGHGTPTPSGNASTSSATQPRHGSATQPGHGSATQPGHGTPTPSGNASTGSATQPGHGSATQPGHGSATRPRRLGS
ncbi:GIY-YIG nuclease family protein [Microbacterium sp. 179-I 3D2 NHS]|uniref:GIY-YIG nuclease family protein n=1 Tax=Microbacterium sp. 179-I 3D2 NHS TaxID=3235178 RepID=UPI0039A2829D